jgi:hypothetical protein
MIEVVILLAQSKCCFEVMTSRSPHDEDKLHFLQTPNVRIQLHEWIDHRIVADPQLAELLIRLLAGQHWPTLQARNATKKL